MERIRFTIAVEPEVHAAFSEMAEVSGVSLSRVVGDWLRDTTEASRFVSQKMRELRLSPAAAMRELQAYQRVDMARTERLITAFEDGRAVVVGAAATEAPTGRRTAHPPSSNTGGKGRGAPKAGPKP